MSMHQTRHEHLIDQFGYRTRQLLNSGADEVSERTAQRLSAARSLALSRLKGESIVVAVPATVGVLGRMSWQEQPRIPRFAFALAALVLALGVLGMNEWREQAQIDEIADLDTAILADEVPFTAHLDPNYKTLLARAQ